MQDIYVKIQKTEEYLRDLRTKLEASEEDYRLGVKATNPPYALATQISPFVNATWASARAAAISGGVTPR